MTARALATLAVCAVGLTACGTSPPPVVRPTEVELPEGVTVRPAGPADDAYPSPALPARTDTFGQAAEALARRAAAL
ncbi:MAG: hypothetical protein KC613_19665, partial [Myxococcales bacterium]|nr:hypothetical protein [Myxococcales bacterium]